MGDRAARQASGTINKERKATLKDKVNETICLSIEGPRDMLDIDRREAVQERSGGRSKSPQVRASHLVNLGEMRHHNLRVAK